MSPPDAAVLTTGRVSGPATISAPERQTRSTQPSGTTAAASLEASRSQVQATRSDSSPLAAYSR